MRLYKISFSRVMDGDLVFVIQSRDQTQNRPSNSRGIELEGLFLCASRSEEKKRQNLT